MNFNAKVPVYPIFTQLTTVRGLNAHLVEYIHVPLVFKRQFKTSSTPVHFAIDIARHAFLDVILEACLIPFKTVFE